jgi:hypothetical protein
MVNGQGSERNKGTSNRKGAMARTIDAHSIDRASTFLNRDPRSYPTHVCFFGTAQIMRQGILHAYYSKLQAQPVKQPAVSTEEWTAVELDRP